MPNAKTDYELLMDEREANAALRKQLVGKHSTGATVPSQASAATPTTNRPTPSAMDPAVTSSAVTKLLTEYRQLRDPVARHNFFQAHQREIIGGSGIVAAIVAAGSPYGPALALIREYDGLATADERRAFWRKHGPALESCAPLKGQTLLLHMGAAHELAGRARLHKNEAVAAIADAVLKAATKTS